MTDATIQGTAGAPCRLSLRVRSLTTARHFYGGLFGWEFSSGVTRFGPYARAVLRDRLVARIAERSPERGLPWAAWRPCPSWITYFSTADADATAALIRDCGGTVAVGPLDARGDRGAAGRLAVAADPCGAAFGVWQPADDAGPGLVDGPGALAWNELITAESSAAGKFYQAVFGLDAEASIPSGPESPMDCLTLCAQGRPVAEIHGVGQALPDDWGAHWMSYFAVTDPDATARRAVELCGGVLRDPHDAPHGRLAILTDPEGAAFAVIHAHHAENLAARG